MCQEWKIEKSVNIFDVFDIPLKATVYVAWFRPFRDVLWNRLADFCLQRNRYARYLEPTIWVFHIRVAGFVKLFAFPYRQAFRVTEERRCNWAKKFPGEPLSRQLCRFSCLGNLIHRWTARKISNSDSSKIVLFTFVLNRSYEPLRSVKFHELTNSSIPLQTDF